MYSFSKLLSKAASKLHPIQRDKIVFINYGGKGFGDNPRYIAEALKRRGVKADMVWLLQDVSVSVPSYLRVIQKCTPRAEYELSTAHFIIENSRETLFPTKRKGQIFLQTWHGAYPFKRIEKDAEDKLSSAYLRMAKEDALRCDAIITDGEWVQQIYKRAFWLKDSCEYLPFGSPRLDVLLQREKHAAVRNRVFSQLQIPSDAYVVLYAPTFRNFSSKDSYLTNLNEVKRAFEQKHGKTVMLVRMHPTISAFSERLYQYASGSIINTSYYPDTQELVIAADCLVSDYSSITFDFALMRKPVFLCMKDETEYISERGVYSVFFEHPFPKCTVESDLPELIHSFNDVEYHDALEAFYQKYPYYTKGTASDDVVDWLIKKGL